MSGERKSIGTNNRHLMVPRKARFAGLFVAPSKPEGRSASGIAASDIENMFEPFLTTRRESGSTGLALGIVRSMLQAHEGRIALASSERGAVLSSASQGS